MTEDQKKALRERFEQAREELGDGAVFSPDQITKLQGAFLIMEWGILEAFSAEQAKRELAS